MIADHFFEAAFGGSFLNLQYLVAARAPVDTSAGTGGADAGLHSMLDANGFPNSSYPLYAPTPAGVTVKDGQLTQACPSALPNLACFDFAVNTNAAQQPAVRQRCQAGEALIPGEYEGFDADDCPVSVTVLD